MDGGVTDGAVYDNIICLLSCLKRRHETILTSLIRCSARQERVRFV
jgi:hypothetical protein